MINAEKATAIAAAIAGGIAIFGILINAEELFFISATASAFISLLEWEE